MIDFFIFHYLSSFTAKRTKRYRLPTGRLAGTPAEDVATDHPACREALESTYRRISQLLNSAGTTPVNSFHRELGSVMIDRCGISRHADGLRQGREQVKAREERCEAEVRVPGEARGPWRRRP